MPYLTTDADSLVRATVDDFLAGRVKPDVLGEALFASRNSRYRVVGGRIHEASDASLTGAELVAFLVEEGRAFRVSPGWTAKARAIFFERATREVVVTSRIVTRTELAAPAPRRTATPSTIPKAPPVPALKPGGSTPPPPLEGAPQSAFSAAKTFEEITKVEHTRAMDSEELELLRDSSANLLDPPQTLRSEPPARPSDPPTMRFGKAPLELEVDEAGDDAPTKLAPGRPAERPVAASVVPLVPRLGAPPTPGAGRRLPPVKPPPQKKK